MSRNNDWEIGFKSGYQKGLEAGRAQGPGTAPDEHPGMPFSASIDRLELWVLAYNVLTRHGGVSTVGDLLNYSEKKLLALPNLQLKHVDHIKIQLAQYDYTLRES